MEPWGERSAAPDRRRARFSPHSIRPLLADLAFDSHFRNVLLDMYEAVKGYDSSSAGLSRSDLRSTVVPALAQAFESGALHAFLEPAETMGGGGYPAPAPPVHPPIPPPPPPPPVVAPGHLVVRVRTPLGAGIAGVEVEVRGQKRTTNGAGVADFGDVPAHTHAIRARKRDYGPVPAAGVPFVVGEATASQKVSSGATATADLQMVTVTSVAVTHTPDAAATPLRIYKRAAGDAHVDHVITCKVECPRRAGAGAGTQIPVRVDWTFTADGGNGPKARGGKDDTDVHFGPGPGRQGMSGSGTTTAFTTTNDAGETSIVFRASVIAGDRFTVHARVLRDPGNLGAGDLGHADSPRFEVWKKLEYDNLFRMQTGANAGVDLASIATVANIQPAFTPAFTEFTVGAPHVIPYQEFICELVPPTAAQLPANGPVRIRSDGPDTRAVTVYGLLVAADGTTSNGKEVLTLAGTNQVTGTRNFQLIDSITAPKSPDRSVTVETSAGAAVGVLAPNQTSVAPSFLFDTDAAVKTKAEAWYIANQTKIRDNLNALAASIGATGYFMVGAAYHHPKMDKNPATGKTNYYAGYPTLELNYYNYPFHPDDEWNDIDGFNQGQMALLYKNAGGGTYPVMVARHEIGHASDHVSYGPGDHCPQSGCLMNAGATQNAFCTAGADHSLDRTRGLRP